MADILTGTTELDAITLDYYNSDEGAAYDNYFNSSYGLYLFLKEKKGLFESTGGGDKFTIPIEHDEVFSAAYARGSTTLARSGFEGKAYTQSIVQNATYNCMYYAASAKILRVDEMANAGVHERISQITQRIANADKSLSKRLSTDFHGIETADAVKINGTLACCYDGDPTKGNYGGIANDSASFWFGRRNTAEKTMSLQTLREMSTEAKVRDGAKGRIDVVFMGPEKHDEIKDQLQMQQRFMESKKVVEAGFQGVYFEGKDIVEDDYVPVVTTGYYTTVGINSNYYGFHVLKGDGFDSSKWMIETATASDKFRDVYFDGEVVNALRKAHIAYTRIL